MELVAKIGRIWPRRTFDPDRPHRAAARSSCPGRDSRTGSRSSTAHGLELPERHLPDHLVDIPHECPPGGLVSLSRGEGIAVPMAGLDDLRDDRGLLARVLPENPASRRFVLGASTERLAASNIE